MVSSGRSSVCRDALYRRETHSLRLQRHWVIERSGCDRQLASRPRSSAIVMLFFAACRPNMPATEFGFRSCAEKSQHKMTAPRVARQRTEDSTPEARAQRNHWFCCPLSSGVLCSGVLSSVLWRAGSMVSQMSCRRISDRPSIREFLLPCRFSRRV